MILTRSLAFSSFIFWTVLTIPVRVKQSVGFEESFNAFELKVLNFSGACPEIGLFPFSRKISVKTK